MQLSARNLFGLNKESMKGNVSRGSNKLPQHETNVMEATRVVITEETRAAMRKEYPLKMNQKKRRQLREKAMLDLVKSKPNGEPISYNQISMATGVPRTSVSFFVTKMEERGKIVRERTGHGTAYYEGGGKPKVNKSYEPKPTPPFKSIIPEPKEEPEVTTLAAENQNMHIEIPQATEVASTKPKPKLEDKPVVAELSPISQAQIASDLVATYAKDFYWETTSNSMHEFVTWMEEKAKG